MSGPGFSRSPSYGLVALDRLRETARKITLAVVIISLATSLMLIILYRIYGERGFLFAGVFMLAVTLVDSLILKALLQQSADTTRKLVEELARVIDGPYALAGGGPRGLTLSAWVGNGLLLVVLSGNKADLVYLRNPTLVDQSPLENPSKVKVRVKTERESAINTLTKELKAASLTSCKKWEYEGILTVAGPHPETPLQVTWRSPGKVVRIRCPYAIDPKRLVSEVSLLLGQESWY